MCRFVLHRTDNADNGGLNAVCVLAPESVDDQKEFEMYIGGGLGLVLLIVIVVMLLR